MSPGCGSTCAFPPTAPFGPRIHPEYAGLRPLSQSHPFCPRKAPSKPNTSAQNRSIPPHFRYLSGSDLAQFVLGCWAQAKGWAALCLAPPFCAPKGAFKAKLRPNIWIILIKISWFGGSDPGRHELSLSCRVRSAFSRACTRLRSSGSSRRAACCLRNSRRGRAGMPIRICSGSTSS